MKTAFEATVEIVVAKMTADARTMCKITGNEAADYIQAVYDKISEIREQDKKMLSGNPIHPL